MQLKLIIYFPLFPPQIMLMHANYIQFNCMEIGNCIKQKYIMIALKHNDSIKHFSSHHWLTYREYKY